LASIIGVAQQDADLLDGQIRPSAQLGIGAAQTPTRILTFCTICI
jgi:hypothetical protein